MVSHVTEVAEGIHRLTNGVANFYLIQESGKLVLVDAGAPKDWALFAQAARTLGKAVGDLDAVLLTHAHTDHTGFAEQARATTAARVWIHEHDAQMARTGKVGPRDGKQSAYLLHGAFWRTALVPASASTTSRPAASRRPAPSLAARGDASGGPAALPPPAITMRSEPELAARTGLSATLKEDMTEFPGTDGGQIAYEVTGLTAAAEEVVAARPELVWDLVADVTRVGGWSPECIQAAWLGEPGRPQPGTRFTGHNRLPNGFEYEVTCVVTEADRPRAFAWVVLDDSGDPARPSSSWRYRIDPLPSGGSRVRQRFTHGPGASFLRAVAAQAPDRAAAMIGARRDGLRANMSATLRAMKAAAESSHAAGAGPG